MEKNNKEGNYLDKEGRDVLPLITLKLNNLQFIKKRFSSHDKSISKRFNFQT